MQFLQEIRIKIIVWFMALFILPSFLWWICNAANDLLRQIFYPSYYEKTSFNVWENENKVWENIFGWSNKVGMDWEWAYKKDSSPIIVKITKLLLSLVIALSVTMILYNWMQYIIQTWQWKEAKDLTKNIAYIVVWILVALFSVVIITLIQSIPRTLKEAGDELWENSANETDNMILEDAWTKKSWTEIKEDIEEIF